MHNLTHRHSSVVEGEAEIVADAFNAEESFQQKLVGDVGENAANVDGGPTGLNVAAESRPHDSTAVAEIASGVAVGPSPPRKELSS